MKTTFTNLVLAGALALAALISTSNVADAQDSGVRRILSGGNTVIPSASTNRIIIDGTTTNYYGAVLTSSNLLYSVGEFDNIGFTFSTTGDANTTNAPLGVLIYPSYDNANSFDPVPKWNITNIPPAPGASTFYYSTNLDAKGISHLSFTIINNTTGKGSNTLLSIHLKSPKFGARPPGGK